jgi:hemolysin III
MDLPVKPRLRGVSHQWAFAVFAGLGVLLVAAASGPHERAGAAVFAGALVAMFGTSAVYHRVDWRSVRARMWMRRLDHAMIYVLIAGTYTPFALLALEGSWRWTLLAIVWIGAAAAILLKLLWITGPKWVSAALGLGLGWAGVAALPKLVAAIGVAGGLLLAVGGLLYTAGAVVYARRRPDPIPDVFGYHEVFHACVIAAASCQFAVVAMLVVA